jgi:tetraacyldisaccharide 4'-kinase
VSRPGDGHRFLRWLWTSRRLDARLLRLILLPLAGLWKLAVALRNLGYDRGWFPIRSLPLPTLAIGNLSVGGSGKTPVAGWVAQHFASRGITPGVLTSGYGRDEAMLHQRRIPTARVIADPNRVAAGGRARDQGARVLILDDAYQLRGVARDYNLAVVSAETSRAVSWPLPAGPWREGWKALGRADGLIVTRKRASAEAAREALGRWRTLIKPGGAAGIVRLDVSRYEGLESQRAVPPEALGGRRVVAASAIADPGSFVGQTKATGALVQVAAWPDHHEFQADDLAWLAKAATRADFLVVTEKDAVKLRGRWPASVPEPLVAVLDLTWEDGEAAIVAALDGVVPRGRTSY